MPCDRKNGDWVKPWGDIFHQISVQTVEIYKPCHAREQCDVEKQWKSNRNLTENAGLETEKHMEKIFLRGSLCAF